MNIEWWEDAKNDLDLIYEYIAMQDEQLAAKIYNRNLDEVNKLTLYATIFAVEPLIESTEYCFRSLVALKGRYKIIYFVDGKRVIITHIWVCRKNPESIRQLH